MLKQSDPELEKYEARLKYQRNAAALMHDATERGEPTRRMQSYEEVLKPEPLREATLLDMPLAQLQELVNRLNEQVARRG